MVEREKACDEELRAAEKHPVAKRVVITAAIAIVAFIGAFAWFVNDYYRADALALAAAADENGTADGITVRTLPSGALAFVPESPTAGLVFYPGAKVQPEAYAPLMTRCAERGVLCVLVKPLFNLALLSIDAADDATAQFPEIDEWIIAGHSMGGVAASYYLAGHEGDFSGIAFIAAYSNSDLTDYQGKVLSIIGTQDGILDRKSYSDTQSNLPRCDTVEIVGGNHANFGNYGDQAGDGQATIPREDQQTQTADAIATLAKECDRSGSPVTSARQNA